MKVVLPWHMEGGFKGKKLSHIKCPQSVFKFKSFIKVFTSLHSNILGKTYIHSEYSNICGNNFLLLIDTDFLDSDDKSQTTKVTPN